MADEIIARNSGSDFPIAPEGQCLAVCVDTIDLGQHRNKQSGKMQHKVALVFQLDELDDDGKRFEVASRFTNSMYDTAYLRKFLSMWRGKSYSDEEAEAGAPLHKLVGVNAVVMIEHNKVGEKTYANILTIALPVRGTPKMEPLHYVRAEYWSKVKEAGGLGVAKPVGVGTGGDPLADEDDDLPF